MKCTDRKPATHLWLPLALLLLLITTVPAFGKDTWRNIDRVVAIGDVHGDYEQYLKILRDNDLIDEQLNWSGAKTHLVQLGDVPDRGPDSLKIMRHLKKLEKQAKRKKGYVHALLGNHEVMNVDNDLRYVHPGEYKILISQKSAKLQSDYITKVTDYLSANDPDFDVTNEKSLEDLKHRYPLGYVEHRFLWAPKGELFEWIKNHNTVIKINRTLFVHGGVSPHQEPLALREINKRVQKYLKSRVEDEIVGQEGPLWYRGLAVNPAEVELEPLQAMLLFYDVDNIVIAHTPTPAKIIPRFDRRVIQADVGLSQAYGAGRASLMIEQNKYYAVHRGEKVLLPADDEGIEAYYGELSRIDQAKHATVEE